MHSSQPGLLILSRLPLAGLVSMILLAKVPLKSELILNLGKDWSLRVKSISDSNLFYLLGDDKAGALSCGSHAV